MPAISFLPFLQGVPASSRLLTGLVLVFSIAAYGLDNFVKDNIPIKGPTGLELPWLVLVPGKSYVFPWVLLSAGLVELSIFEVSLFFLLLFIILVRFAFNMPERCGIGMLTIKAYILYNHFGIRH